MRTLGQYIKAYFRLSFTPGDFILPLLFLAALIGMEYNYNLESRFLNAQPNFWLRWMGFLVFYGAAWFGTLLWVLRNEPDRKNTLKQIWAPATLGLLIYSFRVSFNGHRTWAADWAYGREDFLFYYSVVNQWFQALSVMLPLILLFVVFRKRLDSFFGLRWMSLQPYLMLLLAAVPLVAWASTQSDFIRTYPQFMNFMVNGVSPSDRLPRIAVFELSYAADFVATELFFRGFLILAFVRWLGPKAILPMAIFYVTIHFGKPLGETISSFFGGMLLGIISYHTRSIYGGIVVHVGLAWLMELGGAIGRGFIF